jgi:hypothetical protein
VEVVVKRLYVESEKSALVEYWTRYLGAPLTAFQEMKTEVLVCAGDLRPDGVAVAAKAPGAPDRRRSIARIKMGSGRTRNVEPRPFFGMRDLIGETLGTRRAARVRAKGAIKR